jgi:protein-S-isoprenylcysteine O-methyltransferase Ste14
VVLVLLTVGWLACVVYSTIPLFWLLVHARIEHWRSQRRSPYLLVVPLWIGTWIAVGLTTDPWRRVALYRTPWAWLAALALFALGLWLYREAGVKFSKQQLYGLSELKLQGAEQRLVTTGVRAYIRHPVYLAHLCEMLAWSIGTGLTVCYGLTGFAIMTGAMMIKKEDSELQQRFGESWRAYQDSVPAIFPKLGPIRSRL